MSTDNVTPINPTPNDEVFHAATGIWPTKEMHAQLQEGILRLLKERDPSGRKAAGEVMTDEDFRRIALKVAHPELGVKPSDD